MVRKNGEGLWRGEEGLVGGSVRHERYKGSNSNPDPSVLPLPCLVAMTAPLEKETK